jgi:hypothetical protein
MKGRVFKPKQAVKLKVIEEATGFCQPQGETKYWVRVLQGSYRKFEKGEEFLMGRRALVKQLSKEA